MAQANPMSLSAQSCQLGPVRGDTLFEFVGVENDVTKHLDLELSVSRCTFGKPFGPSAFTWHSVQGARLTEPDSQPSRQASPVSLMVCIARYWRCEDRLSEALCCPLEPLLFPCIVFKSNLSFGLDLVPGIFVDFAGCRLLKAQA
eukprot:6473261-Amphidinium_carterae.2